MSRFLSLRFDSQSPTSHNPLFSAGVFLSFTALFLCAANGQTRTPKIKKQVPQQPLKARDIARKTLPSVIVLIAQDKNGKAVTLGSGFFVKSDIVATNYHVIEDASSAFVLRKDLGERFKILGSLAIDEDNDLVLLKVGEATNSSDPYVVPKPPAPIRLATKDSVEIGEQVYVIGNPEGLEGTFSQGIVSALRGDDYIQITAPISPGSSGGPVMNEYGEVIGIATLSSRSGQNLNFAVPVAKLRSLMATPSGVTPLRPKIELRFDGLYWFIGETDSGVEFMEYFRFHPDGTVYSVGTTRETSASKVFSWLQAGGTYTGVGHYVVIGSEVNFATDLQKRTRADYTGTINKNSLSLRAHFYWSNKYQTEELQFVRVIK